MVHVDVAEEEAALGGGVVVVVGVVDDIMKEDIEIVWAESTINSKKFRERNSQLTANGVQCKRSKQIEAAI